LFELLIDCQWHHLNGQRFVGAHHFLTICTSFAIKTNDSHYIVILLQHSVTCAGL